MAPFEALYGRPCRLPLCWNEVGEDQLLGPDMVKHTHDVIQIVHDRMLAPQNRHKSYVDKRR